MAIKHATVKAPGNTLAAVADWNADHVIDGNTGEVLFLTAGGNVDTDPNFFWDDVNKRLGIGTATPAENLHVEGAFPTFRLYETTYDKYLDIIEKPGKTVFNHVGAGDYFMFQINGSDRLSILSDGTVQAKAGRVKDKTGFVQPVGAIIMYGGAVAPAGWLLCDGASLDIPGIYNDLFLVIGGTFGWGDGEETFNVPDMRGIFPRGAGTQNIGGQDFTGVLGTTTGDSTALPNAGFTTGNPSANHRHYTHGVGAMSGYYISNNNSAWSGGGANNCGRLAGIDTGVQTGTVTAWHYHAVTGGGDSETAPANLGLTYIIKY